MDSDETASGMHTASIVPLDNFAQDDDPGLAQLIGLSHDAPPSLFSTLSALSTMYAVIVVVDNLGPSSQRLINPSAIMKDMPEADA
jgi:hypothetical protein